MNDDTKDKLSKITDSALHITGILAEILSSFTIEGAATVLVGSVFPGITSSIQAYRQHKKDERLNLVIQEIMLRLDEFEARLSAIKDETLAQDMKGKYFELLLDEAIKTAQKEKIEYLVNGYLSIPTIPSPNEDMIRNYYYTMSQLTFLDIQFLRMHLKSLDKEFDVVAGEVEIVLSIFDYLKEHNIDYTHYEIIGGKLEKERLLISNMKAKKDSNIDAVIQYFNARKAADPEELGVDLPRFARPNANSYSFSEYGKQFVKFFFENASQDDESEKSEMP